LTKRVRKMAALLSVISLIAIILWVGPRERPPTPAAVATDLFDGTYSAVEARLVSEPSFFRHCDPRRLPSPLTIAGGIAELSWEGRTYEGQVERDGRLKIAFDQTLLSLQVDRHGTIQGQSDTRACTYHLVWKKE
jgi:hypothetical protein